MLTIKRYSDEDKQIWDDFCRNSKKPLFMFHRDYMEYHKDRFQDFSLLFYKEKELIALLPMSIAGTEWVSHGGLTYGGFITNNKMKQHIMDDCFSSLILYAREKGITKIIYKMIPHIFHSQPAEEDRYALFLNDAELMKVEASTVINFNAPLKMPKGRKAQISRAKREGVVIEKCTLKEDFCQFIELENSVLKQFHNTKAVHTGEELYYLYSRFPDNIHLYGARLNNELIAGTVIYEYGQVVHTQYMAANEEARKIGALDLALAAVIEDYKETKQWLDFGISTENGGHYLNDGLIAQKEGFGGRTNVYETFFIKIP